MDGVNRLFRTSTTYKAGTIKAYRNGQKRNDVTFIGLIEVEFEIPPKIGDTVSARYMPGL